MKENKSSSISALDIRCHVCAALSVNLISGYETLGRVTSDCKPWASGGRLGVCQSCGTIQKVIDNKWETDIRQVYEAYSIYHQGQGVEQAVFEQDTGQASSRSTRLLERLQAHISLPEKGRLLDVGCGNGALLRTFNGFFPAWLLAGTELNDKYRSDVENIDQVEKLYTCNPDQVPDVFNLITMVHLLEHILAPQDFLAKVGEKLADDGLLVVEVPNHHQNPFDLLIVDHATHFTLTTLTALLERAGYEVISASTNWVPKELSVVACKAQTQSKKRPEALANNGFVSARHSLQWLESVVTKAHQVANHGNIGIFGTSIAGTWLFGELKESVEFFVDEDPNRVGKTYLGRPVYHPNQVPADSHVFLGLPFKLAESIVQRIAKPEVHYHLPPIPIKEN